MNLYARKKVMNLCRKLAFLSIGKEFEGHKLSYKLRFGRN